MDSALRKFLLIVFFPLLLFSQKIDLGYIRPVRSSAMGLQLGALSETFNITEYNPSDTLYGSLYTNFAATYGIWFKYKKLPSINIAFPVGTDSNATRGIKLTLPFVLFHRVVAQIHLSTLRGFLFKYDTLVFSKKLSTSTNFSIDAFYLFNGRRFSYKHSYAFGERQIRSVGSFLLGGTYEFVAQQNKDNLFPDSLPVFYANYNHFSAGALGTYGGYLYNWLPGFANKNPRKTFSIGIGGAVGFNFSGVELDNKSSVSITPFLKSKVSLTYHSKKWIIRGISHLDAYSYNYKNKLNMTHQWFRTHIQVLYLF